MRTVDLIQRKRDGHELSTEGIRHLIQGYVSGEIPDYQIAAWLMAVYFQGMSNRETADLTMAMAESGDRIDLNAIRGIKVDKHSTGGVGDTTTLVLAPLVAAAGVPVAKMSGRGLGHTGGTIDKLEAIRGFHVEMTRDQFVQQVNEIGAAVISQSDNITPADKMLYSLRDVTATVESIPLIASSIMSKKIASGADAIVLDVKTGSGAFMKTPEDSIKLAQAMVEIGTRVGRETIAIISSMEQPLGHAIGNALEVKEAILTLAGRGPQDLTELSLTLGSYMLVAGGRAGHEEEARRLLEELLHNGQALEKFKQFVAAQGGDASIIDDVLAEEAGDCSGSLPTAGLKAAVQAPQAGCVAAIDAEALGRAAMKLGAGRETKDSKIDLSAGIVLRVKTGDRVQSGDVLAELHSNLSQEAVDAVAAEVQASITITDAAPDPQPLIYAVVSKDGVKRLSEQTRSINSKRY